MTAALFVGWWFDEPTPGVVRADIITTLIVAIVLVVLSELLRPKPNIEDARPSGLGDFNFPTATEGRVVPLIWGRVRLDAPNVVWYGDLSQEAIKETVKTGLWSKKKITKGFRYFVGMQLAICRGDGDVTLLRAWIGDDEVFSGTVTGGNRFDIDKPTLFGGDDYGTGGVQATVDFYDGNSSQVVSPYLDDASRQRVTVATTPTAPRYTGTCYLVARRMTSAAPQASDQGAYLGNSTSIKRWSFEVQRMPALFSGQTSGQNIIGGADANPINVIYELLTNTEWGFGFAATDIDVGAVSSFKSASDTMISEANGFSMVLDRQRRASDLMQELQRQISGLVFLDQTTGKWTIKLVRDDYTLGTLPALNDSNVKEVRDFQRGSWEDTTNQIQVKYNKRDDDYKESYALAQDMANAQIRGGGSVSTVDIVQAQVNYPGVKKAALANQLAWFDLRAHSYPLARATLIVDRTFWDTKIGDALRWTSPALNFVDLPVRVLRMDFGRLEQNEIKMDVVQDVFRSAAASFGDPPSTGWSPPSVGLVAFPAAQQFAIEAPRAIVVRDPDFSGDDNISRIFAGARRQGGEVAFQITQRNASGTPGGSYAVDSEVVGFALIGQLDANLGAGVANPTATISLNSTPDAQSILEAAFDDNATLGDLGQDLVHLILVNDEFMLVSSASNGAGTDVDLNNVYRGALDSVQQNHTAGDDVFLVFVGAGLSASNLVTTNNVDVELRMRSSSAVFAGAVTTISYQNAKRTIRPYPPNAPLYNAGSTPYATPDLEGDGGPGENDFRVDVSYRRRRYNTSDEVQELLADFTPLASTEYQLRVFVDPDGANTEIASSPFAWQTGTTAIQVPRLEILDIAAAGTEVRFQIQARHDILSETNLTSRSSMIHDVVPTTVNSGLFHLGSDIGTGPSSAYSVASAGVHTIAIGAAMTLANAQYRINGGSWVTIVGTSATTASLSVSDTIEVRVDAGTYTPDPNFVYIDNPSATRVAYGTL